MFALSAILFALCSFPALVHALPTYGEVRLAYVKSDSLLLDRTGKIIHELRTDWNGRRLEWISLADISPALKKAVIQAEDRRFYEHPGLDYKAIGGAAVRGFITGGVRGASTITMQLVAILDRELQSRGKKSIWQKGRQAWEALKLEGGWSKDEILEAYLNLVTFRGELQGIAAASRGLMGKEAHGLDCSEAVILASLIRSPQSHPEGVAQRGTSLAHSLQWTIDSRDIAEKIRSIVTGPPLHRPRASLAPQVARSLLSGRPPGSSVLSTLEGEVQRFALDRLAHHIVSLRSQNVRNGAVLVVENRTGEVLAYLSFSADPGYSRMVDGVQARRQAGSTLKPFLYSLAFDERLLTPASLLDDSPLDVSVPGGLYQPRNYEGQFRGPVPVRTALASSLNVPAVRALALVGTEPFLSRLRHLGFSKLDESGEFYGPALALGSADVSLWELVNAYRCLANGGRWNELHLTPGNTSAGKQIFSPQAAFLTSDILSDREARSITFGLENPLSTRFWTAAKTGTSKDMRDNWCLGFSAKYTVGVWVGNFSGEAMWNVSGISGSALIWAEIMNWLHNDGGSSEKKAPPGLTRADVGLSGNGITRKEWFMKGTEPGSRVEIFPFSSQRIIYPPSGTVIALDPDIPAGSQAVFFILQRSSKGVKWSLNGSEFSPAGKATPWAPSTGKYELDLKNEYGQVIDSVLFEVRGSDSEKDQKEGENPGREE